MNPIPVLCDRCGAAGTAGEDPFAAFGALLDFAPVPRRKTRADGWDAEVQRAFIAALALTGSERAAARAVGKAQFGVTQLLACPGSEGFAAARAEAMAMAAGERSRRLAEGLRAIASEEAGWRPPPPPWSRAAGRAPLPHRIPQAAIPQAALAPPDPADEDAALRDGFQELERLLAAYVIKIHAERAARLAGHIVAADFYVRQICWFEVAIDLVSDDAIAVFEALRVEGRDLTLIARTPFSKMLDEARRLAWAQAAEPDRPPRRGRGSRPRPGRMGRTRPRRSHGLGEEAGGRAARDQGNGCAAAVTCERSRPRPGWPAAKRTGPTSRQVKDAPHPSGHAGGMTGLPAEFSSVTSAPGPADQPNANRRESAMTASATSSSTAPGSMQCANSSSIFTAKAARSGTGAAIAQARASSMPAQARSWAGSHVSSSSTEPPAVAPSIRRTSASAARKAVSARCHSPSSSLRT